MYRRNIRSLDIVAIKGNTIRMNLSHRIIQTCGLVTILLLGVGYLKAQEDVRASRIYFVDVHLSVIQLQNTFADRISGTKFGLGTAFLIQFKPDRPSFVGIGLRWARLQRNQIEYQDPVDLFPIEDATTTNLWSLDGIYRHYLGFGFLGLEPYVEARLGLLAQVTNTYLTSPDDEEFSEFDNQNFDVSTTYGIAMGLNYPINNYVYLSTRMGYFTSLSSEYDVFVDENSLPQSSYDAFERKSSPASRVRYDIGITFAF